MVRLHCPPKRAVRRDACEHGDLRLLSEQTRPLKVADRCVLRRRSRAFGPFESARRSRRTSTRHLDRAASSVRGSDRSRNSDDIPRRSPGDRRSVERFSKTCLSQWWSRCAFGTSKPRRDATLIASARLVAPSLANSAVRNGSMIGGRKAEHRTNLARRRPLRDQLECVSLRRCDLQDRTAVGSKADLGSRRRRQEFPLVNHQHQRLVAKRTPPVQKVETALDRRCDVEFLRLCCAELTSAQECAAC